MVTNLCFSWYFWQYFWKIITHLTIRINWKSNTSDQDEQKYREILFAGKQYSLLVNSLLWPKWALVKTGLLVAFNEISMCQGSIIVYCTTPMIQVPTLHWRRHKAWDMASVLKELFNVIEMKNNTNSEASENIKQYIVNLQLWRTDNRSYEILRPGKIFCVY